MSHYSKLNNRIRLGIEKIKVEIKKEFNDDFFNF